MAAGASALVQKLNRFLRLTPDELVGTKSCSISRTRPLPKLGGFAPWRHGDGTRSSGAAQANCQRRG
jgi:hypothetical protein